MTIRTNFRKLLVPALGSSLAVYLLNVASALLNAVLRSGTGGSSWSTVVAFGLILFIVNFALSTLLVLVFSCARTVAAEFSKYEGIWGMMAAVMVVGLVLAIAPRSGREAVPAVAFLLLNFGASQALFCYFAARALAGTPTPRPIHANS